MHRCIAILGPAIRVLYRDQVSRYISRYVSSIVTSVSRYVIRITIPQAAHHVMSTLRDNACVAIRVSIPPPAARPSI